MKAEKTVHKRLVLHHVRGRLAGLSQILGAIDRPWDTGELFPPALHYGTAKEPKMANHCGTSSRVVQYREWVPGAFKQDEHSQQR